MALAEGLSKILPHLFFVLAMPLIITEIIFQTLQKKCLPCAYELDPIYSNLNCIYKKI